MASRAYVRAATYEHRSGPPRMTVLGQVSDLRFLRVPAGVGQQRRLLDVLGRCCVTRPRVSSTRARRRRRRPSTEPTRRRSRPAGWPVVGFRVSRCRSRSSRCLRRDGVRPRDKVGCPSRRCRRRGSRPLRVSAVSCPSVGAMARGWGRPSAGSDVPQRHRTACAKSGDWRGHAGRAADVTFCSRARSGIEPSTCRRDFRRRYIFLGSRRFLK